MKIKKLEIICLIVAAITVISSGISVIPVKGSTSRITIDCGDIYIQGPPSNPTVICTPKNNYNIDVGDGAYIDITVDYYMDCGGDRDDGYSDIECQGYTQSVHTGGHSEGTLLLTIWFDDNVNFHVMLHALYQDNYGQTTLGQDTKYSYDSTKLYNPPPPNHPPYQPSKPSGPTDVKRDVSYTYTSSAIDQDGNNVYLKFDWGDGYNSGWLGPVPSGDIVSASHSWSDVGDFAVKVIARDTPGGLLSPWSETLSIHCAYGTGG